MGEGEKNQANMKQTNEKSTPNWGFRGGHSTNVTALEALLELPPRLLHCL